MLLHLEEIPISHRPLFLQGKAAMHPNIQVPSAVPTHVLFPQLNVPSSCKFRHQWCEQHITCSSLLFATHSMEAMQSSKTGVGNLTAGPASAADLGSGSHRSSMCSTKQPQVHTFPLCKPLAGGITVHKRHYNRAIECLQDYLPPRPSFGFKHHCRQTQSQTGVSVTLL